LALHAGEGVERAEVDVVKDDGCFSVFFDSADGPTGRDLSASVAAREFRLAALMAASELLLGGWHLPLHGGGRDVA